MNLPFFLLYSKIIILNSLLLPSYFSASKTIIPDFLLFLLQLKKKILDLTPFSLCLVWSFFSYKNQFFSSLFGQRSFLAVTRPLLIQTLIAVLTIAIYSRSVLRDVLSLSFPILMFCYHLLKYVYY